MYQGGFRRWTLGALAAVALLGPACNRDQPLPRTGSSKYEGVVNSQQPVESFDGSGEARQGREPATGGSGTQGGTGTQGANTPPDEFQRPQQQPPPGGEDKPGPQDKSGAQGSQGGIGAPGVSTPREQPTDQGGTRQFEEEGAQQGSEEGPLSPPRPDKQEQGKDAPRQ